MTTMKTLTQTLAALCALIAMSGALRAENLAILIVNQGYDRLPAARDATRLLSLAGPLEDAGFQVQILRDGETRGLRNRLRGLRSAMASADRVVLGFAGHIVSDGRDAYLLGIEGAAPDGLSVGSTALSLGAAADLAGANAGGVLILAAPGARAVTLGPGLEYGYAPPAFTLPQGFSALSGSTAALVRATEGGVLEGAALGQIARTPGITGHGFLPEKLAFLPRGMRLSVPAPDAPPTAEEIEAGLQLRRTERRDIQSDLSILGYDTRGVDGLFGPGSRRAITRWQADNGFEATGFVTRAQIDRLSQVAAVRAAELQEEERRAREEAERADAAFWRETGRDGDEPGLRAYLGQYPDGLFSDLAREQLAAIEAERREGAADIERDFWEEVTEADTLSAYEGYLDRFPDGSFAQEAEARLEALREEDAMAGQIEADRAEERRVTSNVVTRLLAEQRLDAFGYEPGRVDGVYDEATRRAIRRFQSRQNIPATGYVSTVTFQRLLGVR